MHPKTGELFCAHLYHGAIHRVGTARSDLWIAYAKMVVDMYAAEHAQIAAREIAATTQVGSRGEV